MICSKEAYEIPSPALSFLTFSNIEILSKNGK